MTDEGSEGTIGTKERLARKHIYYQLAVNYMVRESCNKSWKVTRRRTIKSAGAAFAGVLTGTLAVGSAAASHDFTTVDRAKEDYDKSEGKYRYGSSFNYYKATARLRAVMHGYDDGGTNPIYEFHLVGNHETQGRHGDPDDQLGAFGFKYSYSDDVAVKSWDTSTEAVQSGLGEDANDNWSPDDDKEQRWKDMAEILVEAGEFIAYDLGPAGLMYSIVETGQQYGPDQNSSEVRFEDNYNTTQSANWSYYALEFEAQSDDAWVTFEPFNEIGSADRENYFTLDFTLDDHT